MTPRVLWAALLVLVLSSCGKDPAGDYGGEDGKKIADLIAGLDDTLQRPNQVAAVFATGAAPKGPELRKYQARSYLLVGKPTVAGSTGTANVAVEMSGTGKKVGEVEWAFVKEGDTWKIKSAPLP